jgi:hypothetical protein
VSTTGEFAIELTYDPPNIISFNSTRHKINNLNKVTINSVNYDVDLKTLPDYIMFDSKCNGTYYYKLNTNYTIPSTSLVTNYIRSSCAITNQNHYGFITNKITPSNPTDCAQRCDANVNCSGFEITADNSCSLVTLVNPVNTYNDTTNGTVYGYTKREISKKTQYFLIFNGTKCISFGDPDNTSNWSGGQNVSLIDINNKPNVNAKSLWRYEESDQSIRSVASNAYMYIDSSSGTDSVVKCGYDDDVRKANYIKKVECKGTGTPGADSTTISFIGSGSNQYKMYMTTTFELRAGTINPGSGDKFNLFILPEEQPTTDYTRFGNLTGLFMLRTKGILSVENGRGYVCATLDTNNVMQPGDLKLIYENSSNPYKTSGTMFCLVKMDYIPTSGRNPNDFRTIYFTIMSRYFPSRVFTPALKLEPNNGSAKFIIDLYGRMRIGASVGGTLDERSLKYIKLGGSGNLEIGDNGNVLDLEFVPILYCGTSPPFDKTYDSVKINGGGSPLNFILS